MTKLKTKKVNFTLIPQHEGNGKDRVPSEPYVLLSRLVAAYHPHLGEARIALAWQDGLQPDKDGKLTLGKAKKPSDLDRQLHPYDLIVLLNRESWEDLSPAQREALIDHELSHFAVVLEEGKPLRDDNDCIVYRLKKHDLEEFRAVVDRHGFYKSDIEEFARVCAQVRDGDDGASNGASNGEARKKASHA